MISVVLTVIAGINVVSIGMRIAGKISVHTL